MIQIKYSMTEDFDSFYQYYGFLKTANDHRDYVSKRDACNMYEHMDKLYCQYSSESTNINVWIDGKTDFAHCVQWLADALGRGQVILHE